MMGLITMRFRRVQMKQKMNTKKKLNDNFSFHSIVEISPNFILYANLIVVIMTEMTCFISSSSHVHIIAHL
jgi:hypothetical protein